MIPNDFVVQETTGFGDLRDVITLFNGVEVSHRRHLQRWVEHGDLEPHFGTNSFFVPGFLINIGKRDLAIAGVDALHAREPLGIKIALHGGTIGELNYVGLANNRLTRLIKQFDLDPGSLGRIDDFGRFSSGRTCRVL
jgi:hypothetical protein